MKLVKIEWNGLKNSDMMLPIPPGVRDTLGWKAGDEIAIDFDMVYPDQLIVYLKERK